MKCEYICSLWSGCARATETFLEVFTRNYFNFKQVTMQILVVTLRRYSLMIYVVQALSALIIISILFF